MYARRPAAVAALLLIALRLVRAGPDPNPLTFCLDALRLLARDDRRVLRRSLESVHALSARLGVSRLVAAVPSESLAQLESWRAANESLGQRLDPSGRARACLTARRRAGSYSGRPTVSILLEYFKRPWVVRSMAANLQAACKAAGLACELVVNADNPHEAGAWAAEAGASGGTVVPLFSANLHESRGYNRAARAARGRYLVVWQDDQLAPPTPWLREVVALMESRPELGLLGMNSYRLCRGREPTNRHGPTPFWEPDPRTGVRWTFAQNVDFAPLVMRGSAFAALGGLDEGWSRPGDCGIWGDWELCQRAWMAGWQVGFMYLPGRSGDGRAGGTHTGAAAERCWGRQQHVGASGFVKRYGVEDLLLEQCETVRRLNLQNFRLAVAAHCPYGSGDTSYGNCTLPA